LRTGDASSSACPSAGDNGPNDDAGEPSDESFDGFRAIDAADERASDDDDRRIMGAGAGAGCRGGATTAGPAAALTDDSPSSTDGRRGPGDVAFGVAALGDSARRCSCAEEEEAEDARAARGPGLRTNGGLTPLCVVRGPAAMNSRGDLIGDRVVGEAEGDFEGGPDLTFALG
jgi:hypothetical protein